MISKAGPVQRGEQHIAGSVAGEHSSPAGGRRGTRRPGRRAPRRSRPRRPVSPRPRASMRPGCRATPGRPASRSPAAPGNRTARRCAGGRVSPLHCAFAAKTIADRPSVELHSARSS
jgi:hypothetical protein